jgi:hypothetical protein
LLSAGADPVSEDTGRAAAASGERKSGWYDDQGGETSKLHVIPVRCLKKDGVIDRTKEYPRVFAANA